jgi:hypothetical protein
VVAAAGTAAALGDRAGQHSVRTAMSETNASTSQPAPASVPVDGGGRASQPASRGAIDGLSPVARFTRLGVRTTPSGVTVRSYEESDGGSTLANGMITATGGGLDAEISTADLAADVLLPTCVGVMPGGVLPRVPAPGHPVPVVSGSSVPATPSTTTPSTTAPSTTTPSAASTPVDSAYAQVVGQAEDAPVLVVLARVSNSPKTGEPPARAELKVGASTVDQAPITSGFIALADALAKGASAVPADLQLVLLTSSGSVVSTEALGAGLTGGACAVGMPSTSSVTAGPVPGEPTGPSTTGPSASTTAPTASTTIVPPTTVVPGATTSSVPASFSPGGPVRIVPGPCKASTASSACEGGGPVTP